MFTSLRPIDVFAAAERLRGVIARTPLRRSAALSEVAGGDVWLKLEAEQVTRSFKIRGAFNALASMRPDERARGVVAASAGNHGLGVAHTAAHFGVEATVFVPATAPEVKRQGIEALGATVDTASPDYDAAHTRAVAFARERGATFIDPCSGNVLLAGQGTVGLEIIETLPQLETLILPVGGAGLLGGVGSLLRAVAPHVRIVGAQSVLTAAMARSLEAGRVVPIPSVPTLAEGLAGGIDDYALDIGRHALDDIVTVEERDIAAAITWTWREESVAIEGSAAVGVAAILGRKIDALRTPAVVIITGGNIDPARLQGLLGDG
ncbi:MAG: threonine/serine dehydratase [Gemmatimonadaceae bacterium]